MFKWNKKDKTEKENVSSSTKRKLMDALYVCLNSGNVTGSGFAFGAIFSAKKGFTAGLRTGFVAQVLAQTVVLPGLKVAGHYVMPPTTKVLRFMNDTVLPKAIKACEKQNHKKASELNEVCCLMCLRDYWNIEKADINEENLGNVDREENLGPVFG
jgi:hypothetical protein